MNPRNLFRCPDRTTHSVIVKVILLLLIQITLPCKISGFLSSFDLIIDEESRLDDPGWEIWEDMYRININTATLSELSAIPYLSKNSLEKILTARNSSLLTGIGCLRKAGLSDSEISRFLPYISFETLDQITSHDHQYERIQTVSPMSFYHYQRYYLRSVDGDVSARNYLKTELRGTDSLLGFVSLSDYGNPDLTRHYSYYLSYRSDTMVKEIMLGKYRLSLGQGIAYASKSGFSKSSAATTHPVKNFAPLRPHTNPFKLWSLEGLAAVITMGKIDLIPFYSDTKVDASISEDKLSTFYPYGTDKKENKNSVRESIKGLSLRYHDTGYSFGCYYSENRFDKEFTDNTFPSSYQTRGIFFNHRKGSFDLFGEWADIGKKTGIAGGMRWGKSSFRHLLLYRSYEKGFPHWHGNPFSSQFNYDNEEGLYYGLRIRPSSIWTINAYFDIWRHPGTRHFEKMASANSEQYLQIIYSRSKDTLRGKLHHKNYEKYRVLNDIAKIRNESRTVIYLDWAHRFRPGLTGKYGIEYITRYIPEDNDFKKGILFLKSIDWDYRRTRFLYQINAFFSSISHYVYEHSLSGMWESRPLTGDDIYSYLIIRTMITDNIRAECKFAYFFSGRSKSMVTQVICRL